MDILEIAEFFQQIHEAKANFIGGIGESVFAEIAQNYLSDDYYIMTDIVLKAQHGTTQIDQIIVSKFGIFVVEIKTYKGWIFGDAHSPQWTQCLTSGKYRFQNPLRQNYKHIKALQELLTYPEHWFKALIVFTARAEFKTELPAHVVNDADDYLEFIESHQTILLSDEQVTFTLNKILENRLSSEEHQAHWQKMKDHANNADTNNPPQCSRCGKIMALRKAKSGNHIGRNFWGCTGYPQCKAVINIDDGSEVKEQLLELQNTIQKIFSFKN